MNEKEDSMQNYQEMMKSTFDNITQIEVSYEGDAPIITAKVPIKKED